MAQGTSLEPHKLTKPIQLVAYCLAAMVLLTGSFLAGARWITDPSWLRPVLAITAIAIVLIFVVLVSVLLTKYRPHFLDDPYYLDWLKRQEEKLQGFSPEGTMIRLNSHATIESKHDDSWEEREERRIEVYQKNRGLFLIHSWQPSRTPGQVADIAISLHQHGDGPLTEGRVESVEYHLGPKFSGTPWTKTNSDDNFRLDVSAYGPMLCLARVNFSDDTAPLDLERYIDFPITDDVPLG